MASVHVSSPERKPGSPQAPKHVYNSRVQLKKTAVRQGHGGALAPALHHPAHSSKTAQCLSKASCKPLTKRIKCDSSVQARRPCAQKRQETVNHHCPSTNRQQDSGQFFNINTKRLLSRKAQASAQQPPAATDAAKIDARRVTFQDKLCSVPGTEGKSTEKAKSHRPTAAADQSHHQVAATCLPLSAPKPHDAASSLSRPPNVVEVPCKDPQPAKGPPPGHSSGPSSETSARGAIPKLFQRHRRMHARSARAAARSDALKNTCIAVQQQPTPLPPDPRRLPGGPPRPPPEHQQAHHLVISNAAPEGGGPLATDCEIVGNSPAHDPHGAVECVRTQPNAYASGCASDTFASLLAPPTASWQDLRALSAAAAAPAAGACRAGGVEVRAREGADAAAEGSHAESNARVRKLLERLNEWQRAAVLAPADGPLLVAAGPGSGKTSAMIARVSFLMSQVRQSYRRVMLPLVFRHAELLVMYQVCPLRSPSIPVCPVALDPNMHWISEFSRSAIQIILPGNLSFGCW